MVGYIGRMLNTKHLYVIKYEFNWSKNGRVLRAKDNHVSGFAIFYYDVAVM